MTSNNSFCFLRLSALLIMCYISAQVKPIHAEGKCPSPCICGIGIYESFVYCKKANLKSIPDDLPANTKELHIYENKFDSNKLYRSNLGRYSEIQRLDLVRCSLKEIDPDTFAGLVKLRHLDLSHNNLKVIQPSTFSGLKLDRLILGHNPGVELNVGAFEGLRVQMLYLHNCDLTELDPEVFLPIVSSLEYLTMLENRLEEIPEDMKSVFSELDAGLIISSNPLKCDCKLKWFKEFYKTHRRIFFESPECATPRELENRSFSELSTEDFKCAQKSKRARALMQYYKSVVQKYKQQQLNA